MAHCKLATVAHQEMVAQLHFPAALSAAQLHTSDSKACGLGTTTCRGSDDETAQFVARLSCQNGAARNKNKTALATLWPTSNGCTTCRMNLEGQSRRVS